MYNYCWKFGSIYVKGAENKYIFCLGPKIGEGGDDKQVINLIWPNKVVTSSVIVDVFDVEHTHCSYTSCTYVICFGKTLSQCWCDNYQQFPIVSCHLDFVYCKIHQ